MKINHNDNQVYFKQTQFTMSESNVIDETTNLYNRTNSTSLKNLTKIISGYYRNNHTLITTSGIHAITTTLLSIGIKYKWSNFNIVYASEMYACTHKFLQSYLRQTYTSNVAMYPFTVTDIDYLKQIFEDDLKGKINVLFVESCSNPNGHVLDFRIIPYLRSLSRKLIVVVDNTWTTHEIFQPFDNNADITVISMTKYYSGGTAISGACIFSPNMKDIYNIAFNKNKVEGVHILPSLADHLTQVVPYVGDRVKASSNLTIKILDQLLNKYGTKIMINHSYINYNIFFNKDLYPSVFTIVFKCDLKTLKNTMMSQNVIPIVTSFGAKNTRIDPYSHEYTSSNGEITSVLRIAVGYDDRDRFEEIVNTLKLIIDQII